LTCDICATVKRIVKDCLTENNGVSYCPVRCFGAAFSLPSMAIFMVASARMALQPKFPLHDFAMSFSIMMGAICAGFGVGIAVKAFTDTSQTNNN
jgi:hypothetical protein